MAKMVDITAKEDVPRRAAAEGDLVLRPETVRAIRGGEVPKGDPLHTAEVAGLQAVKRTSDALPHCHPIPITSSSVRLAVAVDRVRATCEVSATYKTGVEMEALYGCAVALLTVWDMVKALEKDERGQYPTARIENLRVTRKEKGDG